MKNIIFQLNLFIMASAAFLSSICVILLFCERIGAQPLLPSDVSLTLIHVPRLFNHQTVLRILRKNTTLEGCADERRHRRCAFFLLFLILFQKFLALSIGQGLESSGFFIYLLPQQRSSSINTTSKCISSSNSTSRTTSSNI